MRLLVDSFRREAEALGVDPNSLEEFLYWLEPKASKHAWIEPLKSDQASDETWVMKEHPELLSGRHPLYAYSDDELKDHGIIIIGSTPVTKNWVKNFKLNFEDKYEDPLEEKDEQDERDEQGEN